MPKLVTGEDERKEQMKQAPVLHHQQTTLYAKRKQTGKKIPKQRVSSILRECTRLNGTGEKRKEDSTLS